MMKISQKRIEIKANVIKMLENFDFWTVVFLRTFGIFYKQAPFQNLKFKEFKE